MIVIINASKALTVIGREFSIASQNRFMLLDQAFSSRFIMFLSGTFCRKCLTSSKLGNDRSCDMIMSNRVDEILDFLVLPQKCLYALVNSD